MANINLTGYKNISANASGSSVTLGFDKLGPVTNFSDLLITKGKDDPTKLAAQQIVHLLEAWRYLTSATSASLINSKANAIHFAYYAQLRAVFSLFAFSGIHQPQKNSSKNYYLNGSGINCNYSHAATHEFARALWPHWISRSDIQGLMLNNIRLLPTVKLDDFASVLPLFNSHNLTINLGADLGSFNDHKARNIASYQPYWLEKPLDKFATRDVNLISELWGLLFKQSSTRGFDSAIIQYQVEQVVNDPSLDEAAINQKRKDIALKISQNTGTEINQILNELKTVINSYKIFDLIYSTNTNSENVISRAYFLSYIATLALKHNLSLTTNSGAKNWITHWLEHAGIWNSSYGYSRMDVHDDYTYSWDVFSKLNGSTKLPEDLWDIKNAMHSAKICKPEAYLAWELP